MAPVRVPVILPKAVTTTDTDEFSVKSADYSVNNDLPSSSPSDKTVLMILCGLVGFFVFVVLAVEFRSTLGFEEPPASEPADFILSGFWHDSELPARLAYISYRSNRKTYARREVFSL